MTQRNTRLLIVFVTLSVVAYATIYVLPQFFGTSLESGNPQEPGNSVAQESTVSPAEVALSDDARFPAPVMQLQAELARGLVESSTNSLPLLRGDLQQFSQQNIDDDYVTSNEVSALRDRLNALKSLNIE
jgi:hypothetical protein